MGLMKIDGDVTKSMEQLVLEVFFFWHFYIVGIIYVVGLNYSIFAVFLLIIHLIRQFLNGDLELMM